MGNINESLKIIGLFKLNVFEYRDGLYILKDFFEDRNLVVNDGLEKLTFLLANNGASNYVSQIGYGTDNTAVDPTDTGLTGIFKKAVEGTTSYPTSYSVQFDFDLDLAENNGVIIKEYGLFCVDDTLFARKVIGSVAKENNIYISGSWTISFYAG